MRKDDLVVCANQLSFAGPASTDDRAKAARDSGPVNVDVDESPMLLDDTKYTTYVYDIDRELADIEGEEKHMLFIPDIEKALNAIPKAVLHDPKPENELVLYGVPRSLTVDEDKDIVRKAIIESRARAKTLSEDSATATREPAPVLTPDQMDVDS